MQRKRKKSGIKKEISENIHNKAQINYIVQKKSGSPFFSKLLIARYTAQ